MNPENGSEMEDGTNDVKAPSNQEGGVKTNEYVKELLKEKLNLDPSHCPIAMRLLDDEIVKAQTKGKTVKESRYVDIYREKPVRVAVKVLVPVKEHPKFNFVGKLLGPKGNSLKRLQEETMTRMAILGRGSMRDKAKEEECRNTLDPKYAHLSEDLHVEVVALAPPAEAHARIAFALAEIRKYLVPDSNDEIRMEQLREIQATSGPPPPPPMSRGRGRAALLGGPRPNPRGGPIAPPLFPRVPGKTKVLSILDRARVAMEESYNDYEETGYYDDVYGQQAADYTDSSYSDGAPGGRWKGYKTTTGTGRYAPRPAPYSRPLK